MKLTVVLMIFLIVLFNTLALSQFLKVGLLLGTPYAFWQGEKLVGIDYELFKLVAKEMGMQVEFYLLPFSVLDPVTLPKLGLDIIACGIHMTEERKKQFNFSDSYLKSGLAIILRKDLTWDGNVEKITFGVKKGATAEKIIQDWIKSGKKISYMTIVSNEEIITNLLIKKIDAAFFDYINALYLSRMYGLVVHKELVYSVDIGAVISNTTLKDSINSAIKKLIKTDEIRRIVTSYVGKY
ncbi:ABC transporter substrate-binding protein [Fervidobacterium sp.]